MTVIDIDFDPIRVVPLYVFSRIVALLLVTEDICPREEARFMVTDREVVTPVKVCL